MGWRKHFLPDSNQNFRKKLSKIEFSLSLHLFENLFKRREYVKKVLCRKGSKSL